MSLQRLCDACEQPMEQTVKRLQAGIKSPSGRHLATVHLDVRTRTGAEHVCWGCVLKAVREAR